MEGAECKNMKVFVTRTNERSAEGKVREYENLDICVKTLLEQENYFNTTPEVIVSQIDETLVPPWARDCDWEVEVYNTWRE